MYTLIIVDDEERIRQGLKKYMPWGELGYQVVGEAGNGREALELIEKLRPDVILCDIKMPIMDGISLVTQLRERGIDVKVIFLTGFTDYELMRSAIKLGVKDYVQKPVASAEVREIFERLSKELNAQINDDTFDVNKGRHADVVQDIKDYIEEHYQYVQLSDLEKETGYSRFYLSKLFAQETGVQFSDYLRDIRLRKAAALLNNSYRLKVYEVSDAVGYQNYKSFSKAFVQKFGITPSDYQKRNGK